MYNVVDGEATIIGYIGSATELTIPSELGGCPVTTIEDEAFSFCESLTSVTIPDSVTTIGGDAFYNCNVLTTVYFTGSEDQWNSIYVRPGNDALLNANIIFNSTGPAPLILWGDANGEGVVDLRDASKFAQYANDDTIVLGPKE